MSFAHADAETASGFLSLAGDTAGADVTVVGSTAEAEEDWRALERRGVGSPYQRFDFVEAWMRHLGRAGGAEPLVVICRRGGAVHAVLPLVVRRIGGVRVAAFAGGTHANFNTGLFDDGGPAIPAQAFATLVRGAVADAGVDLLKLVYQPREIAGRPNPLVDASSRRSAHATYDVSLDGGFEAVLSRHRGSKKRKRLRSHARAFDDIGGYRVARAASVEEAREVARAFFAQKAVRFAEKGLPNVFAIPGTEAFVDELIVRNFAAGGGLVDVYALSHAEGISATGIALPYAGVEHYLMNSFADDRFARVGPGEMTLFHMLEDAAARGLQRLDFGVGDARYKRSWCDREVELVDTLMPLTATGAVAVRVQLLADRIKSVIRDDPRLYRIAQRFRRGRMADDDGAGGRDDGED